MYLDIYRDFDIESMQEMCIALQLFGYIVSNWEITPSIELALVCLVITSKFYDDNSLWISDVIKYCNNMYIYLLEKKIVSVYI